MLNKHILRHAHNNRISEKELYATYKIFFGTLVSEPRLKIINLLRKGRKNVSEITRELKMRQAAVSHDLARLKKCGFVKSNVENGFRYYALNDKTIKPLLNIIDEHMSEYCIHILHGNKGEENGK